MSTPSTPDNSWSSNGPNERGGGSKDSEAGESLQSLYDGLVGLGVEVGLLERRIEAAIAEEVPEERLRHALEHSAALGEETARVHTLTTGNLEDAQQAMGRSRARAQGEFARTLRRTRPTQGRTMPPYKDEAP
jgi:hypothetical protein